MKKVYAWLSDEERDALARYCEREGRSMYAVLKEAVVRIIQGESSITPKQDNDIVPPSVKAVRAGSPELEERVGTTERGLYNLSKEFEKPKFNEELWKEVGNIKERLTRLEGINTKEFKKIAVDAAVEAVEELGLTRGERV